MAHITHTVSKFQQATMGSLLKYYREKIYKQRSIIDQLKKERAELVALRRCGWRERALPIHSTDCSVLMSSFIKRTNICATNSNIPATATQGTPTGPQNDKGSIIMGDSDPSFPPSLLTNCQQTLVLEPTKDEHPHSPRPVDIPPRSPGTRPFTFG
jgi:hypothetical protein